MCRKYRAEVPISGFPAICSNKNPRLSLTFQDKFSLALPDFETDIYIQMKWVELTEKTLNFLEHLIFAKIRKGFSQGVGVSLEKNKMSITPFIMVRFSTFQKWQTAQDALYAEEC